MVGVTKKLEITIGKADLQNPDRVIDFARKNRCLGISIIPEVFLLYLTSYFKSNFTTPLGVMVNYPIGASTGMHKFTNLPEETDNINFYDLMLRDSTSATDYKKEIQLSLKMIKSFNSAATLRITLDPKRSDESNIALLEATKSNRIAMINVGITSNSEYDFEKFIKMVRKYSSLPIKLVGKITPAIIEKIESLDKNVIYGVSPDQALSLQRQEDDYLLKRLHAKAAKSDAADAAAAAKAKKE